MFQDTLDALRHLLWPSRCASCDLLLDAPNAHLCEECRVGVRFAGERPAPEALDSAFSFFYYEGAIQSMITRWKYHEDYAARLALLACMGEKIMDAAHQFEVPVAVVPVPPHPRRLRERGFDPVWTLASKLSSQLSTALNAEVKLVDECLHRSRHTVHQAGLSAEDRAQNLVDAFSTEGPVPERILLVDDVMTTGATMTACALALRAAGAQYVAAMSLACTSKQD